VRVRSAPHRRFAPMGFVRDLDDEQRRAAALEVALDLVR
jgi:hypothetical protein